MSNRRWVWSRSAATLGLVAMTGVGAFAGSVHLKEIGTIKNPVGPIDSFDIGFVDQQSQRYYLADRSNKSIDIVDTTTDKLIGAVGGFVGLVTKDGKPANSVSGPDGVLAANTYVWAGDGDSTLKVIDLTSMNIVDVVKTGGRKRVDEMAIDPTNGIVIAINNSDEPPFASLISTAPGHKILGKIVLDNATDGAEQPVYNPRDGLFYVSIPELNHNKTKGGLAMIDPHAVKLVRTISIDNCSPTGLDLGDGDNLVVGCNADGKTMPPITVILDAKAGDVVSNIAEIGAADMVAYNPTLGQYYTASRNMPGGPVLGVIDATTNTVVQKIPLTGGTPHSVAVDHVNNHVYVPQGSQDGGCGCIRVFAPE